MGTWRTSRKEAGAPVMTTIAPTSRPCLHGGRGPKSNAPLHELHTLTSDRSSGSIALRFLSSMPACVHVRAPRGPGGGPRPGAVDQRGAAPGGGGGRRGQNPGRCAGGRELGGAADPRPLAERSAARPTRGHSRAQKGGGVPQGGRADGSGTVDAWHTPLPPKNRLPVSLRGPPLPAATHPPPGCAAGWAAARDWPNVYSLCVVDDTKGPPTSDDKRRSWVFMGVVMLGVQARHHSRCRKRDPASLVARPALSSPAGLCVAGAGAGVRSPSTSGKGC